MTDPRITKEMVETLAARMANSACDWLHNDCGDDEHALGHSNWEAYIEDAQFALEAVFALLPEPGLSIRQQAVRDRANGIRRTDLAHDQEGYDNCWEDPYWSDQ